MDAKAQQWQEKLTPDERDLVAKLKEICAELAAANIKWIEAEYEGKNDDGFVKEISCTNFALETMPLPQGPYEQLVRDALPIFLPDDWMDGSFGSLYLRTVEQQVDVSHADDREGG